MSSFGLIEENMELSQTDENDSTSLHCLIKIRYQSVKSLVNISCFFSEIFNATYAWTGVLIGLFGVTHNRPGYQW